MTAQTTPSDQEKLIAFVNDPKTIAKAVVGSMEKRQKVLDSAPSDELKEKIRWLTKTIWPVHSEYPNGWQVDIEQLLELVTAEIKKQKTTLLNRLLDEAIEVEWTEEVIAKLKTYRRVRAKAVPVLALQQELDTLTQKEET